MRALTKSRAYEILFKISKKQNIDISKYIDLLSKSKDEIPIEVILFINKYNSSELPQLKVFNIIYERRRTNPLYENIMNESATPNDQCLALTSIITQCLLQSKNFSDAQREAFVDIMNVKDILDAISSYLLENNTKKLRTVFFEIRAIFKNLFSKNNNKEIE